MAALLVVSLVLAAAFWIGVLLLVLGAVGWFNLLLLPRLARRARVREIVLALALLPLLATGGFALGGLNGAAAGCAIWVLAVALPRAMVWRFRRKLLRPDGARRLRRTRNIDARYRS